MPKKKSGHGTRKEARARLKKSLSFLDRFKERCQQCGITRIDGVELSAWTGPIPSYVRDLFNKVAEPDAEQMRLWVNACENYAISIRDALHR